MTSPTPATFDVIIVGTGYAGRYAAARLKTRNPNAKLLMIDPHDLVVERARSHEHAAGSTTTRKSIHGAVPKSATFVRGHVTSLRPETGECDYIPHISSHIATRDPVTARAHYFIIATGSRGRVLDTDGSVPMFAVDDPQLRAATKSARNVAVVGAGLSGIELACELAQQTNARVTLVADAILPMSSVKAQSYAISTLEDHGIERVTSKARSVFDHKLQLSDNRQIDCDLIVTAIGFTVDDPFHLNLAKAGAVRRTLQHAQFENVFVVGDAAHQLVPTLAFSASCALAMPMGIHSAENVHRLLNGQALLSLEYAQKIRCIGLGRRDGIVDFTDEHGVPLNRVVTGRLAAFVKERILKMTHWALALELRTGWPVYFWPKPSRKTQQLKDMRESGA